MEYDLPSRFFDRAPLPTVIERITAALRAGKGFSLVRLGDGEGGLLCADRGKYRWSTGVWFGRDDLSDADLALINEGLCQAIRSADVLGLPTRHQIGLDPGYLGVFEALVRLELCSASQILTDANVHWYLQLSGALGHLLKGADSLCVIGCRDIGQEIANTFGISSVRVYQIRGENQYPGDASLPHWPEGFEFILDRLSHIRAGTVFLVGAGVLGKIYCHRIKEREGIAIDVGSLIDAWAGVPSRRRYVGEPSAFTLKHFKTPMEDWKQMRLSLKKYIEHFEIKDATY